MKRRTVLFMSIGMLAVLVPSLAPAASNDGMYGDIPRDGIFDGSLTGSLVSGTEYTGISMVDIIFFALLAFAFLSVMRMLRASRAARQGDSQPKPQSRHTMPRSPGPREHDPWARLRSTDASPTPQPAPRQDLPVAGQQKQPSTASKAGTRQPGGQWDALRGDISANQPASVPRTAAASGADYSPAASSLRKDFDMEDFLKGARILFARLQESFDRRDFDDIALFATPEVVEDMRAQAEKEVNPSGIDILLVKASLISLNIEDGQEVAEVFFDVLLREGKKAEPSQVKEVWYFVHPVDGGFWQLDGIRQVE